MIDGLRERNAAKTNQFHRFEKLMPDDRSDSQLNIQVSRKGSLNVINPDDFMNYEENNRAPPRATRNPTDE
jgi:hypothetical protein